MTKAYDNLFVVFIAVLNAKSAVYLLDKHNGGQRMRKGHTRHGKPHITLFFEGFVKAV